MKTVVIEKNENSNENSRNCEKPKQYRKRLLREVNRRIVIVNFMMWDEYVVVGMRG